MSKPKETNEVEQFKKEIEDWKSKYLRALADYQNLEKRITTQRKDDIQYASRNIVVKLLPIIDVLEKVNAHLSDEGLTLVLKQLHDMLTSENVEKLDVVGKPFDPHSMECIEVIEGEKDDTVLEEIEPGYKMFDQIIRVARVKVGKKPETEKDNEKSNKN